MFDFRVIHSYHRRRVSLGQQERDKEETSGGPSYS